MSYVFTNDPNDPCAYEVQWMTEDGRNDFDPYVEKAEPFIAPGVIAPRIYRFVHDACEEEVIAYSSEANQ